MRTIVQIPIWVIALVAVVAGLGAIVWWIHFIWSFDWGYSFRGRTLWLMALVWSTVLGLWGVGFAAFLFLNASYSVLDKVWYLIFGEHFE